MKKALVTGITGQDGSYLAELLLEKGYEVHGVIRRASSFNTARIEHLYQDQHDAGDGPSMTLHYGDLADGQGLVDLMLAVEPDEVYNLGAQSHVRVSFDSPIYTHDIVAGGALRVLEAARRLADKKPVRVYQASSSEMFGKVHETPQKETTPFYPRSPYACAKVAAFHHTVNYRRQLRAVRRQRDSVQPRIAPPRRDVRDAEDHPRRHPHRRGACRRSSIWATRTANGTGASPRNTSKACGGCCRPISRTTTSSPPA